MTKRDQGSLRLRLGCLVFSVNNGHVKCTDICYTLVLHHRLLPWNECRSKMRLLMISLDSRYGDQYRSLARAFVVI